MPASIEPPGLDRPDAVGDVLINPRRDTHHHAGHGHATRGASRRSLGIALALNLVFTMIEAGVGFATGSLALLADAGHNLSDVIALAVALVAVTLASRPPTTGRTFGLQRVEILSALFNATSLVVIGVLVFVESAGRIADPPEVPGSSLVVVAGIGVIVNLAGAAAVFRRDGVDLNLRASFVHLAGDAAASVGVIAAGVVILTTGWRYADPLASLVIGVLILASSWGILRDSVLVLLEAAPRGTDVDAIGAKMVALPGVAEVHDLHVWTITSGFPSLSAHVLVHLDEDCHAARRRLERLLREEFGIEHSTLQTEHVPPRSLMPGKAGPSIGP